MKSPARRQRISILVVRIFLGVLFVYASINKILYPGAFAGIVYNYHILPDEMIHVTAVVLPWLELLLGLFLILDLWLPGAVLVANALLTVFLAAIAFNMARGLNIDCGCFTPAAESQTPAPMIYFVIRDSLLLISSLYLGCLVLLRRMEE
jgi:uncharacterized membrane protein YphA (DoxX/SURF4 family)